MEVGEAARRILSHYKLLIAFAVIGGLVLVVYTRLRDDVEIRVVPARTVDLPAPAGFQAAVLPYASIAYPEDWYLLDTSVTQPVSCPATGCPPHPTRSERRDQRHEPVEAVPGPVLQLANFDPDVSRAPRCVAEPDSIPRNGVLLTVDIAAKGNRSSRGPGEWPASLEPYTDYGDPVCAQIHEQATWRAPSGVLYWASAGWGRSAAQEDINALHRAFRTMRFPPRDRHLVDHEDPFAFIHPLGATNGRPDEVQEGRTPRVVLDSVRYGHDVLTFVAYLEPVFTGHPDYLSVGVGSSRGCLTQAWSPRTGSDREEPVQVEMSGGCGAARLLDGVISPVVGRVEMRTQEGDAEPIHVEVPMHVYQLPASLGIDRYVWALVTGDRSTMLEEIIEGYDGNEEVRGAYVVGYDRNGDLIPDPTAT